MSRIFVVLIPFFIIVACSGDVPPTGPAGKVAILSKPTNLRCEVLADSSVYVSWDGVDGAMDYDVNYKKAVGGTWTNWPHKTATFAIITGLAAATEYRWAVRADHRDGPSKWVFGDNFMTTQLSDQQRISATDQVDDRAAMMAIWEAVGRPDFRKWGTRSSLRKWEHIEVDRESGRVVALDLDLWAIYQQTDQMFAVPLQVGQLTALRWLRTGSLLGFTVEVSNLVNLEWLYIWSEEATEIPPEYGNLQNLIDLNISCGNCRGSMPASFGQLHQLNSLIVRGRGFNGALPELHNRSLKVLDLTHMDSLSGTLTPALDNLPSLEILMVQGSQLEYPLPTFSNSPNLRHISVSLFRTDDAGKRYLPALGPLPPEWANLRQLEYLSLANAVGELPPAWGALTSLQTLQLRPEIYGELPLEWSGMTSLERLYIHDQEIEGTLPESWSALTNLEIVDLEENLIDGALPGSWAAMDNLTTLKLSYNFLEGSTLPADWGNLKKLEVFECEECGLEGPIPDEWQNLISMTRLWLPYNNLSGTIPDWWDSWTNLETLLLVDNNLSGPYPQSFGRVKGLAGGGTRFIIGRGIFTGCVPRMLVSRDTYWSIRYDGWRWNGPALGQSSPNTLRFCSSGPHYNWEAADARNNWRG